MTTAPQHNNTLARLSTRNYATGLTITVKLLAGIATLLVGLTCWVTLDGVSAQQQSLRTWDATSDYGVFYPHKTGDNLEEFQTGGNSTTLVEARDLYPYLDKLGALFIDAVNYEPGNPSSAGELPARPIIVNTNYLDKYPLLDETRTPIQVDADETDWVVAVPARFKALEGRIRSYYEVHRVGSSNIQGAVQAQGAVFGEPAPARFSSQGVKIIWTADAQSVFTFDTTINPDSGSTVTDPVVEIMTAGNSLPIDRANAITGSLNTPLKVYVGDDPVGTQLSLAPKLKELKLDDNLTHLVTASEAITGKLNESRSFAGWLLVGAILAALFAVLLGAIYVAIRSTRLRRSITIRRLHGYGTIRAHVNIWRHLAIIWVTQAIVALAIAAAFGATTDPFASPGGVSVSTNVARMLGLLVVITLIDAVILLATIRVVEKRQLNRRLKEL